MVNALQATKASILGILIALLCFCPGSAVARGAPPSKAPQELVIPISAAIGIGIDGKLESIEWLNETPALNMVVDAIAPHVRRWEFEPGMINGVPAATRSFLRISILARANDEGVLSLTVQDAATGMRLDKPVIPRYPAEGIVNEINAVVTTVIDVDADGKASVRSAEYMASMPRKRYGKFFLDAVSQAVAAWRIEPERVGGHPIAGSLRIPYVFCTKRCEEWETQRKIGKDQGNLPVALDSATKLRTKVEGLSIGSI